MGSTPLECAQVDVICEHVRDIKDAFSKTRVIKDEAEKKAAVDKFYATDLPEVRARARDSENDRGTAARLALRPAISGNGREGGGSARHRKARSESAAAAYRILGRRAPQQRSSPRSEPAAREASEPARSP